MKRIISFLLLTVISLGLVACQQPSEKHEHEFANGKCECGELHDCKYYKGQCTCGKLEPSSGPVDEDNIPTPYTDSLKLTANYIGKNFSNDGIGEVVLASSTDGDTAIFKDNNRNITVRFNGVNTPESTYKLEPWGVAASKFTKGKLENAEKIVLQTDTLKTNRFDSTGERYLAWVWYLPKGGSEFRLLNLEIIENSFSASKASGMMYADVLLEADMAVQKQNIRIWNKDVQDPDYDYSDAGKYMTLKELRDNYDGYTDSHIKVVVRGVVARKIGPFSAYIQQQEDGVWHIGNQSFNITASEENPEMPEVGVNGNWWIGEIDTEIEAVDGEAGQTLYEYYQAVTEDSLELPEAEWYDSIVKDEIQPDLNVPYILQDGEWYGMYLYGGFDGISSRLTIGYEVKVEGNIGTYMGALQITGITSSDIKVLSPVVDAQYVKQEPHVYEVEDTSALAVDNAQMMGVLVKLSNLTVVGGYNTAGSDAFTIKCTDAFGNRINIRVDSNSAIKQDKVGELIEIAPSTATTAKKCYYEDGPLNNRGLHNINCWQYFEGKTITELYGIVTVYDGDYSEAEIQVMLTRTEDIVLA